MKKHLIILASVIVGFTVFTARAQPGGPPSPSFDGAMAKLFGDNTGFSATMELHLAQPSGEPMTMTGKMAFLDGKNRFEMDMSTMQGGHIPPQALARMKQMGMGKMTMIARPDKDVNFMLYPDMKAYTTMALNESNTPPSAYKLDTAKQGEETIDGHDCVKNKVVVTGPDGVTHEATVWNAGDLKQFPVKIQLTSKAGQDTVMLFKEVKLGKPDDAQFDPPADFKKYDDMMSLMMSRNPGAPPQ